MRRLRPGSALILMLGMLAFLTISAIAFSAYMRAARLPSSFMLRASSSRWLVKAALAEAMNEIEGSIGNNPHPGVPATGVNRWRDRIFQGNSSENDVTYDWGSTQPVATFEGLAYVPAPLVNVVRYYGRHTPTALWHEFDFDAGRYAYVAVDVSDYFDVNRTKAWFQKPDATGESGGGRTSADESRVTLAYLFENDDHESSGGLSADLKSWTDFMDDYVSKDGSLIPLASWADLNLAIRNKKPAGVRSPWCDFVDSKGQTGFEDDGADDEIFATNMVFLTDSVYAAEPNASSQSSLSTFDLADPSDQPFKGEILNRQNGYLQYGFDQITEEGAFNSRWTSVFPGICDAAQLYDYLDVDGVPCSLALPSVERAPMITGLRLDGGYALKVDKVTKSYGGKEAAVYRYEVTTYTVSLAGELEVKVGLAYPFKSAREALHDYQAQAFATVTFVPADEIVSPNLVQKKLRFSDENWATKPVWGASAKTSDALAYGGASQVSGFRVLSAPAEFRTPSLPLKNEAAAVLDDAPVNLRFTNVRIAGRLPKTENVVPAADCTLRVIRREKRDEEGNWVTDTSYKHDPEFAGLPSNVGLTGTVAPADGKSYRPVFQVWVRVLDTSLQNAVVDLVPACTLDAGSGKGTQETLDRISSISTRSAFRFAPKEADGVVTYRNGELVGGAAPVQADFEPALYVTDDPRFNFAPENFCALPVARDLKEVWAQAIERSHAAGRDGDIFMTTSDSGYLQSKYEFAHLVRLRRTGDTSSRFGVLEYEGYDGAAKDSFDDCPAADVAWRTYVPWGANADAVFSRVACESSPKGARVCPYTPGVNVMMGALANTPRDWWAASTNFSCCALKNTMLTKYEEALKYTFSEYGADSACRVQWEDLADLARTFIGAFRKSTSVDGWQTFYDAFAWDGSLFDGIEENSGATLDAIDRKYLYGYWRDCFAARQQLFLVFVRAEPMMLGGGGHVPATLGGRAVALVWRDPYGTGEAPHQMRILFYKPLD